MKYFKLLLCTLLALPSASFAMQEPIDQKNNAQLQLTINAGIDGESECRICSTKAKLLPADSLRLTDCCWQFICASDAEKIIKEQKEKQMTHECPLCHKKFSVHKVQRTLGKVLFRFIDNDGVEHEITDFEDYQTLKRCDPIKDLINDAGGMLDLRDQKSCATGQNIKLLIQYIKNPRVIANQSVEQNMIMLHLADYLQAPENILFELSNLVWENIQEQASDSADVKEEKKIVRGIAEPYLYCPFLLLRFMENNPTISVLQKLAPDLLYELDFSYHGMISLFNGNTWFKDENGLLYNLNKRFKTLRGLEKLINKLAQRGDRINLQHNNISSLDDEFFNFIKELRSSGKTITIDLRNNSFTDEQKNEIRKKWDRAINTLPERICSGTRDALQLLRPATQLSPLIITPLLSGHIASQFPISNPLARYSLIMSCGLAGFITGLAPGFLLAEDSHSHEAFGMFSGVLGAYAAARNVFALFTIPKEASENASRKIILLQSLLIFLSVPGGFGIGWAAYATAGIACRYGARFLARISHPGIKFNDEILWNGKKPRLFI